MTPKTKKTKNIKSNTQKLMFKRTMLFFLLAILLYSGFTLNRLHYVNALVKTKIENFETEIKNDVLEISFDIKNAPKGAAMYIYVRDEKAKNKTICDPRFCPESIISDDLIKIQNGRNITALDISNFTSSDIYVSLDIKPYNTQDWKRTDVNCSTNGAPSIYIPIPLVLCNNPSNPFSSISKHIKE